MGKRRYSGKRYSETFKSRAIRLVNASGRPVTQVAKELKLSDKTLHGWVRAAKIAAAIEKPSSGKAPAEEASEIELLQAGGGRPAQTSMRRAAAGCVSAGEGGCRMTAQGDFGSHDEGHILLGLRLKHADTSHAPSRSASSAPTCHRCTKHTSQCGMRTRHCQFDVGLMGHRRFRVYSTTQASGRNCAAKA